MKTHYFITNHAQVHQFKAGKEDSWTGAANVLLDQLSTVAAEHGFKLHQVPIRSVCRAICTILDKTHKPNALPLVKTITNQHFTVDVERNTNLLTIEIHNLLAGGGWNKGFSLSISEISQAKAEAMLTARIPQKAAAMQELARDIMSHLDHGTVKTLIWNLPPASKYP